MDEQAFAPFALKILRTLSRRASDKEWSAAEKNFRKARGKEDETEALPVLKALVIGQKGTRCEGEVDPDKD